MKVIYMVDSTPPTLGKHAKYLFLIHTNMTLWQVYIRSSSSRLSSCYLHNSDNATVTSVTDVVTTLAC